MMKNWISLAVVVGIGVLSGCSRDHGLIGGGQNNSVVLKSIALTPLNPTVALNLSPAATQQFVAIGSYNIGNPQDITKQVTWISSDTTVVTIDSGGMANTVNSGRAFITAQLQDQLTGKVVQAETILTVIPKLTGITVSPTSAQIAHGTARQFIATGNYNDKTSADVTSQVTWTSSQPAFATVSGSPGTRGLATGVSAGSSTITAILGALNSTASLTVTNADLVSIAVTPGNATVPLASTQQFVATGSFDDGTTQDISTTVSWSSTDSSVARAAATGSVKSTGLGDATVQAASGGVNGSAAVTVDASSVSSVSVVPVSKIANGTNEQMRAIATFNDGSSSEVTHTPGVAWTSSNAAVASVDANGLATATGAGSTSISAGLGSKSGSTTLNVSNATMQSLAVAPGNATIAQGAIQNLVALATFSDGGGTFQQDISSVAAWSSDDTSVATVSYVNGLQELARGISPGTAHVSASFAAPGGGFANASVALNVNSAQLSSISLTPGSAAVPLGGGQQFVATGNFGDGSQQDLTLLATWGSLDPTVATVTPMGFAGASGPGQTSVSATFGSQSGSGSVVVNPAALVKIDICTASVANPVADCPPLDPIPPPPPIAFANHVPFAFVAIGTYSDGSRADLTSAVHWSSSATNVASISNEPGIPGIATGVPRQGVATGLQAGTTTIKADAGGVTGSVNVFVTAATLQFVTVTPVDSTIAAGTVQQFSVMGTLTDGTTQDITPYVQWVSSNPNVAVVNPGGLALSSGTGTGTVTATMNGASGGTTLTVR